MWKQFDDCVTSHPLKRIFRGYAANRAARRKKTGDPKVARFTTYFLPRVQRLALRFELTVDC